MIDIGLTRAEDDDPVPDPVPPVAPASIAPVSDEADDDFDRPDVEPPFSFDE